MPRASAGSAGGEGRARIGVIRVVVGILVAAFPRASGLRSPLCHSAATQYNPKFLAFAIYYGFVPAALPNRKPGSKGKVEKPFQHVEYHLLDARDRDFRDPARLCEFTAWWLDHVSDPHPHRRTGELRATAGAVRAGRMTS